MLQRPIYSKSS